MDGRALTPLHRHLRRTTQAAHAAAEAHNAFLAPELDAQAYGTLLERLLALWGALEARIAADERAFADAGIDVAALRRTALLQRDLAAWTAAGQHEVHRARMVLPAAVAAPGFPRAAGCLYVVTGARLGGIQIGRHLMRQLGCNQAARLSFWLGDARTAKHSLRTVMARLDAQPKDALDMAAMVESARACFALYGETVRL